MEPSISDFDKRQWFYDLDEIFKIYLRSIFGISQFNIPDQSTTDLYHCNLLLQKKVDLSQTNKKLGFYTISSIFLENGTNKVPDDNFPFLFSVGIEEQLPEELIINPENYTAKDTPVKSPSGQLWYYPILEKIHN
jgi:hypothetical protein